MPLCTQVGFGPVDIVLDGDPGAQHPHFLVYVYCSQTAGWMNMPLGMEVDLSPGHIVSDGDPGPFR